MTLPSEFKRIARQGVFGGHGGALLVLEATHPFCAVIAVAARVSAPFLAGRLSNQSFTGLENACRL
jgi:hypothetical protein